VANDGNFTLIDVGSMTKRANQSETYSAADADLPEIYEAKSALIFARVSSNFPNAQPYGVITVPYLVRSDGRQVEWQHLNNANSQAIIALLGRSDVGFWSWGWQNMSLRKPEDLVAIVEWARKCVREGAA
jgi:hypothetical protein